MSNKTFLYTLLCAAILLLPATAQAHTLAAAASSWGGGFMHPFLGLDHLLAMLAVGIWAVQQGGSRIWQLPAAFLSMMMLGAYAAFVGLYLPALETGIAGSLLVLGLMLAFAVRLPMPANLPIVGIFALFHGYAHAAEMLQSFSPLNYVGGFLLATALLHGLGITSALLVRELHYPNLIRLSGLAIGLTGGLSWI